jgi:hypothetical protein
MDPNLRTSLYYGDLGGLPRHVFEIGMELRGHTVDPNNRHTPKPYELTKMTCGHCGDPRHYVYFCKNPTVMGSGKEYEYMNRYNMADMYRTRQRATQFATDVAIFSAPDDQHCEPGMPADSSIAFRVHVESGPPLLAYLALRRTSRPSRRPAPRRTSQTRRRHCAVPKGAPVHDHERWVDDDDPWRRGQGKSQPVQHYQEGHRDASLRKAAYSKTAAQAQLLGADVQM